MELEPRLDPILINPAANDGLWKIQAHRQALYTKAALSLRVRIGAAEQLIGR
jgi:hypothetical protein